MRTTMSCAAAAALVLGCGGSASRTAQVRTTVVAPMGPEIAVSALERPAPPLRDYPDVAPIAPAGDELAGLPHSPWQDAAVGAHAVAPQVMAAWRSADNRDWCEPLALTALGAGEGAQARVAELEGGWVVEYDRQGARGLRDNGNLCAFCGRGAFGVAGTSMSPVQIVEDMDADGPAPTFEDGSHASIEEGDFGSAAATVTLREQGCVYQIWSFYGADHVRELVEGLRRVDVTADDGVASTAAP